ncbi:3,4-dihydroxy-2-butanone-4-phosphate synthase [Candidatus Providencia siddallii]|uniref:3,4-dihydroxy-2-butanone 4-phosphate synthase n=1 Tax=Candidatus Providencia siddallii TaxID=1715285 RepID=A0ABM9NNC8_9GAMM
MECDLLFDFGNSKERVENAIIDLQKKKGVLVIDDENRENEGDIIFAAETITIKQMAFAINYSSGIICLCITENRRKQLNIPMMVKNNTSKNQTAFTVSIEAANGITTGVSAADRVKTIHTAIADNANPSDINHPGHVFPLLGCKNGVLNRRGHTEASIDLATIAGFKPAGVLCELTNNDGTMARTHDVIKFAKKHKMTVMTIDDLVKYRLKKYQLL